jgi:raffinose/stachyose/melibiose transport system substrate-binding protein
MLALSALAALTLGGAARPAADDTVTINMIAFSNAQPGLTVLIANFERVYPNIKIDITYAASPTILSQVETTELAAGNAPDLLWVYPACGTQTSICILAKDGYLAPMVAKPWARWLIPLVASADKYGAGLFTFSAQVSPFGIFTNDDLFKKLGLSVPQTFSQLLTVCQRAKAAGTVALWTSGDASGVGRLAESLAVTPVYGADPKFTSELKAGKVTFDGNAGWHTALQELVQLNQAGCFQPGLTSYSQNASSTAFAQGQGLMLATTSSQKGFIDGIGPQFSYSFHPLPAGAAAGQTMTALNLNMAPAVNAHSSAANQAAAQSFIDFLARPKQTDLYAQIQGGITQYEFQKNQVPAFMSSMAPVLQGHEYVILPDQTWWNAGVDAALAQSIGLLTGQLSIDDVLNGMDAAWKQGPS